MRNGRIKIKKKLVEIDRWVLDLLYPPRCPVCDKVVLPGSGICDGCKKKVQPVGAVVCLKCGKKISDSTKEFCWDCSRKSHSFAQGKAVWVYERGIKASLYRFKYQNRREYAAVYAGEIAKEYGTWIRQQRIQGILPVPLHRKRKSKRGYNQAEILAKELGRLLELPVYTDILIRTKDTKPQKLLNDAERKNNLKKAFKTAKNVVKLEYILVVDDICTTGSTLDAVAEVLLGAGALKVYACCVSIGSDC